jgi:hypothetical protein
MAVRPSVIPHAVECPSSGCLDNLFSANTVAGTFFPALFPPYSVQVVSTTIPSPHNV